MKRANKLAEAHWAYIEALLSAHEQGEPVLNMVKFHYVSAFEHGYKHALEDVLEDSRRWNSVSALVGELTDWLEGENE